jgi:hypothetical protein
LHTCLMGAAIGVVGRGLTGLRLSLDGRVVRGVGFGAATSRRGGVEAGVANKVLPGLGDVLGELGDEVHGIEDLEVAGGVAEGRPTPP